MVAVVDDDKLAVVLGDFARTVITDSPIQGILDQLVARAVEILPIASAGVTLVSLDNAHHYSAASDAEALRLEVLQADLGEGPCLTAFTSDRTVTIPDLARDIRFPRFARAAAERGLAAAFAVPLRHETIVLGGLDLYRDSPGDLDAHDLDAAQTLADVAAAYVLNAKAREDVQSTVRRLHHLSMHDPLTGLPNRLLFEERIEHAARRAERSHASAAVLFADLDHFKDVNDTYGHHVGDELLRAVGHRLRGLLRPGDTLARFSGDEFVVLCEDLSSPTDVDGLAARVYNTMATPFVLSSVSLSVTASVGIAFAGPGEDVSNQLVVAADRAMYVVKHHGRGGHRIVDVRSGTPAPRRNRIEDQLSAALAADQLDVAYQPIVRTRDHVVVGVEALLRWTHPEHGAVPPLTVVALAEQCGLINDVGAWVLERACRDHKRWLHDNPAVGLDLAVNVSATQLTHPGFANTVADVLSRTGMDPMSLILELTEGVLVDDSAQIIAILSDLCEIGIRVAIDDFGTGYSSLSYLTRLPIDIVKIDQCFIADTDTRAGRTVVRAITNLAHDLGLTVVAEGVESQAQHERIYANGCDAVQGNLYARPMTATAIRAHRVSTPATPATEPSSDDRSAATTGLHASSWR